MSWASTLCALYDANAYRAGKIEQWNGKPLVLLPLGYDTMESQIEVTIDTNGNFLDARTLDKSEAETIVPYPEGRTSGIKALPLFDKLIYLAGDFIKYSLSDTAEEKYKCYLADLNEWCTAETSNTIIRAVFQYVSKGCLIEDLVNQQVLILDESNKLSMLSNIQNVPQTDAFIRFRIFAGEGDKNLDSAVWLDRNLQTDFIKHYMASTSENDLCYLCGEHMRPAKMSPIKIRNKGDQTRLISSNDSENYTYRGRFNTKDKNSGFNEALSIGYETSQKIHNALKWIIRRQGYVRDGICMVTWESSLNEIPSFFRNSAEIISSVTDEEQEPELTDDAVFGKSEESDSKTNYITAKAFNMAIDGYSTKLRSESKMMLIALDSASQKGRLAMTYYRELAASRYLENIRKWHNSCCWRHAYFKDKKYFKFEGMVSIKEVAEAIYGTEQNKTLTLRANSDGKKPMLISAFERLRPCIIDGAAIPRDMVHAAVQKASNPLAYDSTFNRERVLHTACSLVKRLYWEKKQKNDPEGVIFEMELDQKNNNRSYLYGRMLAVAEKAESLAFDGNETRITNAERYMQAFSRMPFRTWDIIWRSVQPYMKQLKPKKREYYKNLIGEITALFDYDERISNKMLDGRYLLGYDCQREALKYKGKNTDPENITENKTEDEE
jgi:CRISPR-associated protein Csd1